VKRILVIFAKQYQESKEKLYSTTNAATFPCKMKRNNIKKDKNSTKTGSLLVHRFWVIYSSSKSWCKSY